jgi:hypothetical protein
MAKFGDWLTCPKKYQNRIERSDRREPRWRRELEFQKQREVDERFKAHFGWRSVK